MEIQQYSIGDLAKLSGIKAHTIRMWERRYGVIKPRRTTTNIRYYFEQDLLRILNISILTQIGYKISKIAYLSDEELRQFVLENIIEVDSPEVLIETLIVAMLSLDEYKFLQVLNGVIERKGIEYTFETVGLPFIERLGIMCDEGTINEVQRNFIFNLIRQKLIVAIDEIKRNDHNRPDNRIIFFMPKAEWGETSLLFYSLIARIEGYEVLYLGTSVPLESLKAVYKVNDKDILFFSVDSQCTEDEVNDAVPFLNDNYPDAVKIISGINVREKVEEIVKILKNSHLVCSAATLRRVLRDIGKNTTGGKG